MAWKWRPARSYAAEKDYGIKFYGITSGMEFPTLLEDILMVSFQKTELDQQLEDMVRAIDSPVQIRVMVTLTCPYCPRMVRLAHQFAFLNDKIRGEMVDASQFQALAQRYDVQGVPHTVINESAHLQGSMEAGPFYLQVLKAVDPEQYREIEEVLREAQGKRKVGRSEEGHVYDVTIIGAGPAGMSAADLCRKERTGRPPGREEDGRSGHLHIRGGQLPGPSRSGWGDHDGDVPGPYGELSSG